MGGTKERHALVFGASGIIGRATVNAILEGFPTKDEFAKITALVNRPLALESSGWASDPRLEIVSGIDLLQGNQSDLNELMREKIPSVKTVSHVYFFAYKQIDDNNKECQINEEMLERSITAVEFCSSCLTYVVLPSGTKIYGVHMLDQFPFSDILPLTESAPPLPEPWFSQLFYYNQFDCLKRMSKGKKWTWCEVRPDNIIGFVPNNNAYCLAQSLALYLSLFRYVEGKNAWCPFPGSKKSWKAVYNESPQDMVARFSILASLKPEQTGGKSFNIAGQEESWSSKWPVICDYFELRSAPPDEKSLQPNEYIENHKSKWAEMEKKVNLKSGYIDNNISHPAFQHFIMTLLDFDRYMDMSASRYVGYTEVINTKECWNIAFGRMRRAKIIP